MLKKLCFTFLLALFAIMASAEPATIKTDTLVKILKLGDASVQKQKLIRYLDSYFSSKVSRSGNDKIIIGQLLLKYNIDDRDAIKTFIESLYLRHNGHNNEAIDMLKTAIDIAGRAGDHYLLYSFFYRLGFYQTSLGYTIDAVSSFRAAKKEAITMKDDLSQVIVDINISDIYYKNNFYNQSISHLNQALDLVFNKQLTEPRLLNIIYYNKAENYFRMNELDSLLKYDALLNSPARKPYKLYIFRQRTGYYIMLLKHNYASAIQHIKALQKDTLFKFDDTDRQNLADAYYHANMPDSAKVIINSLMADPSQNNHPEVKFHLYKVLANIAEQQQDDKQAAYNYKMALQQSEDHINRLTQVGNISSQMNVDEMQNSYTQREERYKRERLLLIFVVIISVLTISIGAMFYRNAKQKRYYEKLLFDNKKEELAFINSHEVRRHLSNILGIVGMIKQSDKKTQDYLEAEEHLIQAAENLDDAIKNISQKLDD